MINGNCLEIMSRFLPNAYDAVITDPPYGISFMGKKWDDDCPKVETWQECLRVLKPGGHLLSFSGTRTIDLIMGRLREAGFEIRDTITWLYGSGFPKSHNIGKAIDKKLGAEREVIGKSKRHGGGKNFSSFGEGLEKTPKPDITAPATQEAKQWEGWGTALKPACEFIVVARKPFKGTVVDNVLKHGTGAMNIDECRIGNESIKINYYNSKNGSGCLPIQQTKGKEYKSRSGDEYTTTNHHGRWPANLILDQEAGEMLDEQSGELHLRGNKKDTNCGGGMYGHNGFRGIGHSESGKAGASRFFYCAKASKRERGENNFHPTIKPQKLMEYLVKLVTPKGGHVLDPFMGSGSTGVACKTLGFNFTGIELNEEYFEIARKRIE